jgi:transposase
MTKGSIVATGEQTTGREVIGFDLSDKSGTYAVLDAQGKLGVEGKVVLDEDGLARFFGSREPARVAIEAGTHSPWVSRQLAELGHEVIVANPRRVKLISGNKKKNDREDARLLARLGRVDPELLHPVQHRGEQAQADLAILRSRDCLVRARTALINHARGEVKSAGGRLPKCSAQSFASKARPELPAMLEAALLPTLATIDHLSGQIEEHTKQLEQAAERYLETQVLRRIKGVGPLTSLAFVLTLEEPERFAKSRSVGAFLGLTTRQADSGESQPALRITKAGDPLVRRLLVQSAHYILGRYGPDCDLRRWGLKLAGDGGNKIRKRKAVVAVARKLAVLLHHLWANGVVYEPLWSEVRAKEQKA